MPSGAGKRRCRVSVLSLFSVCLWNTPSGSQTVLAAHVYNPRCHEFEQYRTPDTCCRSAIQNDNLTTAIFRLDVSEAHAAQHLQQHGIPTYCEYSQREQAFSNKQQSMTSSSARRDNLTCFSSENDQTNISYLQSTGNSGVMDRTVYLQFTYLAFACALFSVKTICCE